MQISGADEGKTDGLTRSCMGAFQPFSLKTGKTGLKKGAA
jgi:hypothetical protein